MNWGVFLIAFGFFTMFCGFTLAVDQKTPSASAGALFLVGGLMMCVGIGMATA